MVLEFAGDLVTEEAMTLARFLDLLSIDMISLKLV
jgi:hypothetical protein